MKAFRAKDLTITASEDYEVNRSMQQDTPVSGVNP